MNFGRLLTAMVTPFNNELEIDLSKVEPLISHLVDVNTEGLVVAGTTGESPTLTVEEKIELWREVKRAKPKNMPMIAGTGSNSTKSTIELSKRAEKIGADGIMLVTPYYNKPPQKDLFNHFQVVAQEVDIPVMLYNVPKRTGANLEPETVFELAKMDNIVAIKEASGDMEQLSRLSQQIYNSEEVNIDVYSGEDSVTLPMMSLGAKGVVSVASQIAGHKIFQMIESFFKGEVGHSAKIHSKLLPVFQALTLSTNPIPVKEALNLSGVKVGGLREPLSSLDEQSTVKLQQILTDEQYI